MEDFIIHMHTFARMDIHCCFPGLCSGLRKTFHVTQGAIFSHDFSKSSTATQRET